MRSQRVSSAVRGGLPSSITLALAFSLVLPALISTAPAGAEPNTLAGRQAFRAMVASTEKLRREGKLDEAVGACEAFLRAHPDAGMLTTMAVGRIGHILRGPEAKELRAKLAAGIPVEFPDCLPYVCLSGAWRAQDMLWGTAATEASVQEAERLLSGLIDELGARFPVHDSPGRQVLALRVQALRRQDRLDEALTSYSAALYLEHVYDEKLMQEGLRDGLREAYAAMFAAKIDDRPANLPAEKYSLAEYGTIVYGKAAIFFDELRAELGPEAFLKALQKYYSDNLGKSVTEEALLKAFRDQAESPEKVDELYRRWIVEANGFEDVLGKSAGKVKKFREDLGGTPE